MNLETELDWEGHRTALLIEHLGASEAQTRAITALTDYRQKVYALGRERDALREAQRHLRTPYVASLHACDCSFLLADSSAPCDCRLAEVGRFLSSSTPEEKPQTETRSCHEAKL